jgi:hypothetical protein
MLIIHPHKGVGPVTFGMTRDEVRRAVGEAPDPVRAPQNSEHFAKAGMLIHYDENGKVEAVGLTQNAAVSYNGYDLFAHSATEVRQWARGQHVNLDDENGFVSTVLGLSMSAPGIDEADLDDDERHDPAQSFLVFRSGYYEEGLGRAAAECDEQGDHRAAEIIRGQLNKLRG